MDDADPCAGGHVFRGEIDGRIHHWTSRRHWRIDSCPNRQREAYALQLHQKEINIDAADNVNPRVAFGLLAWARSLERLGLVDQHIPVDKKVMMHDSPRMMFHENTFMISSRFCAVESTNRSYRVVSLVALIRKFIVTSPTFEASLGRSLRASLSWCFVRAFNLECSRSSWRRVRWFTSRKKKPFVVWASLSRQHTDLAVVVGACDTLTTSFRRAKMLSR